MTATPPSRRLLRAEQVLLGRTRRVAVVLEFAQDPHNVHAVLRTAEALGVQDVHLVAPRGEAGFISAGVTQRAHDWLSVRRHASMDEAAAVLRAEGRVLWAADNAEDAASLTGLFEAKDTPDRLAILLGNESDGLSQRALELSDRTFRIDLVGFSGSVNMSVAAGIILWEWRRREVLHHPAGDLTAEEEAPLRAAWYAKLLSHREKTEGLLAELLSRAQALRQEALDAPRVFAENRPR